MVVSELAQEMHHHHHHHEVGSIAVKAAHHAGMEPLIARDVFDRMVGAFDAGVEKDEEVNAADGDDPEKEETERAELRDRIERRAEQPVERSLDQLKSDPEHFTNG